MNILTPTEARRDLRRSPALRRALRSHRYDPDVVAGLSAERIQETLQCIMVGTGVHAGMSVMAGKSGAEFAWSGNTNVTIWIADSKYRTLSGSDVDTWTTQQAYTTAGVSTTFTFSTPGNDPLWEGTGINGSGAIRFDRSNSEHMVCDTGNFLDLLRGDDTPITVVSLVEPISSANNDTFWQLSDTANFTSQFRHWRNSTDHRITRRGDTDAATNADFQAVSDAAQVDTVRFEGTQTRFYVDDTEDPASPAAQDNAAINNANAFSLGCTRFGGQGPANFLNGRVAVLAFIRNDDTTAIQQVEDYCLSRGGL